MSEVPPPGGDNYHGLPVTPRDGQLQPENQGEPVNGTSNFIKNIQSKTAPYTQYVLDTYDYLQETGYGSPERRSLLHPTHWWKEWEYVTHNPQDERETWYYDFALELQKKKTGAINPQSFSMELRSGNLPRNVYTQVQLAFENGEIQQVSFEYWNDAALVRAQSGVGVDTFFVTEDLANYFSSNLYQRYEKGRVGVHGYRARFILDKESPALQMAALYHAYRFYDAGMKNAELPLDFEYNAELRAFIPQYGEARQFNNKPDLSIPSDIYSSSLGEVLRMIPQRS